MNIHRVILICTVLIFSICKANAQESSTEDTQVPIDYLNPKEYEIGGITVSGTQFVDESALKQISGLLPGDKVTIPGEDISKGITNLWKQKLFSHIEITQTKTQGKYIFLNIHVVEQPRIAKFKFNGVTKTEADNLRDKVKLERGKIASESLKKITANIVRDYYVDKGYLNCTVDVRSQKDSTGANAVVLVIDVSKQRKVRIKDIHIDGNRALNDVTAKRAMKEIKEKFVLNPFIGLHKFAFRTVRNIFIPDTIDFETRLMTFLEQRIRPNLFKTSKFEESNYEADKELIIAKYNDKGFRDAKIVSDTVYKSGRNTIDIRITVSEGRKYYFRNINWIGNTKHSSETLGEILGIKKGDVYNQSILNSRLYMSQTSQDVSSLYMDDGYLFFNITPVEVLVQNDSIDLEMRIYEGQQARINKVWVVGNSKTNDHVIMRELYTKPGQLFSRADIIQSQRQLANLGYFDPEKLNVQPHPNPTNSTVDIEYIVEEKPSDQIQLSGGWGGGRVVGTLGVSFTNFSTRNMFKPGAWTPLPAGDGQRLSLSAQSNGPAFQSYNASFTEPWLGGKKPNSLTISAWHSVQSNGLKRTDANRQFIKTSAIALGLGSRLKWPDQNFFINHEVSYQNYELKQWFSFIFPTGYSNNIFYKLSLTRSSTDQPIYPRNGSQVTVSMQMTPPYSYIRDNYTGQAPDYNTLTLQEKYKFVEYYKWKVTSSWYTPLTKDKNQSVVLYSKVGFGFLGFYNKDIGQPPFERFYLGGSGLTGFSLYGREIIALRGYDDQSVSSSTGGSIISKYTSELRVLVSPNPSATIYVLGFAEAGNTWNAFDDYNPFEVKKSAGAGIRIFLPMFGLLGLDWGHRFDTVTRFPSMNKSQIHFTIGMNLGEL